MFHPDHHIFRKHVLRYLRGTKVMMGQTNSTEPRRIRGTECCRLPCSNAPDDEAQRSACANRHGHQQGFRRGLMTGRSRATLEKLALDIDPHCVKSQRHLWEILYGRSFGR